MALAKHAEEIAERKAENMRYCTWMNRGNTDAQKGSAYGNTDASCTEKWRNDERMSM